MAASNRTPSAIDALGEAISHMREKLFPFSFLGWITLGFVALLESCGADNATGALQQRGGQPGPFGDPAQIMESVLGWISGHMLIVISVLIGIMLVSLLLMWLRSRAIFVYLDDVASGRFDLVRPWGQHGAHADSFFVLSLLVQGAAFILLVLILALGAFFVIWARAHDWRGGAIALSFIPIAFLFVLALIAAGVLSMALRDFVAPLQVSRNISANEAGDVVLSLVSAYPGLMIGYAVLKFVAGLAVGIVMFIGGCLTCCLGFLPLIRETLFQPIYYAERAWSLKLLAQLGDDLFAKLTPRPTPPPYVGPDEMPTGPIDLSAIDFETPPQS